MSEKDKKISKFLSYILRHEPESIGLELNQEGWASIDELIKKAKATDRTLSRIEIEEVVRTNDKNRFTISDDGLSIRAVQGHSSKMVQIDYVEKMPPEFLYHGTATRFIPSIKESGLISGSRHHVHLSFDEKTAVAVGQRHGSPIVLIIKSSAMFEKGFKFFQADNGVWLTEAVATEYIIFR